MKSSDPSSTTRPPLEGETPRSPNPCGIPRLDIGRDVKGRFRLCNMGGPGNPFARKVAALRKTLLDCVSEDDLKVMITSLKEQAKEGDKTAIKLILQYCVGKPEAPRDPDRMDIDEWDRFKEMSASEEEFEDVTDSVPACLACHQATFYWPCNIQDTTGHFAHAIHRIHNDMNACAQPAPVPAVADEKPEVPTCSPTAPRPSSTQAKPNAKGTRRDRRSSTPSPSPNGDTHHRQSQTMTPPPMPSSSPAPSGQSHPKPPPG